MKLGQSQEQEDASFPNAKKYEAVAHPHATRGLLHADRPRLVGEDRRCDFPRRHRAVAWKSSKELLSATAKGLIVSARAGSAIGRQWI